MGSPIDLTMADECADRSIAIGDLPNEADLSKAFQAIVTDPELASGLMGLDFFSTPVFCEEQRNE